MDVSKLTHSTATRCTRNPTGRADMSGWLTDVGAMAVKSRFRLPGVAQANMAAMGDGANFAKCMSEAGKKF